MSFLHPVSAVDLACGELRHMEIRIELLLLHDEDQLRWTSDSDASWTLRPQGRPETNWTDYTSHEASRIASGFVQEQGERKRVWGTLLCLLPHHTPHLWVRPVFQTCLLCAALWQILFQTHRSIKMLITA